jgi:hypothetical protein
VHPECFEDLRHVALKADPLLGRQVAGTDQTGDPYLILILGEVRMDSIEGYHDN